MPENNQRGGFFRGVGNVARGLGRGISNQVRNSPIGHAVHGEFRQAWNTTPIGRLVNALGRMGNGPNTGGSGPSMPSPSAMGAYGPMADGYAGIPMQPQQAPVAPQFGSEATTNWAQLAQAMQGQNASQNMGLGAYGNPSAASGAWALGQGAMNPLRQSGDTGLGRMRPQQN